MRAAVLYRPKDIRVEDVEAPTIGDMHDVIVRVHAVGICGSDIHYYERGRIGKFVVEKPIILGHECSGEVVEVGTGVKNLKPGDRVAIEPQVTCRRCWFCKTGKYNLCPEVEFFASPPTNGAFCEYIVAQDDFLFTIPPNISYEEAALVEPLAVAIQAVKRGGVKSGDSVFVAGAGPIGLMVLQAAKAAGATLIYISDIESFRLALSKELGASRAILATKEDVVGIVKEATGGYGVDVAFEAASSPDAVRQCMELVKPGGVVVLVGMFAEDIFPVHIMDVICREYDLRGVFRYCNCYPIAVELISSGRIDVEPMITHRYPLDRIKDAIEFAQLHKSESIKVVVEI